MTDFLTLALVFFFVVLGSLTALKFKIPALVIFLMLGVLISSTNLVQQNVITNFLSELGSILLLFVIGSEFSIYKLVRSGFKKGVVIAVIEMVFAFSILYYIFLGWFGAQVAILLALAFSITSTGISLRLLQELHLKKHAAITLIAEVSVIEDFIAVLAFTIISSFSLGGGETAPAIVTSILYSLLIFILAYYVFYLVFNKFISRYKIDEDDLLVLSLGILLGFVFLSGALNLSTAFGAYIAGSIVSSWREKGARIERNIKKFSYVFISFFFLTIGMRVDLGSVNFVLLLAMLPLVLLAKGIGVFAASHATLRSIKTAAFVSFGMLPMGELSLVIINAAVTAALLPQSYLGLTAFIVFLSTIISFVLLIKTQRILSVTRKIERRI